MANCNMCSAPQVKLFKFYYAQHKIYICAKCVKKNEHALDKEMAE